MGLRPTPDRQRGRGRRRSARGVWVHTLEPFSWATGLTSGALLDLTGSSGSAAPVDSSTLDLGGRRRSLRCVPRETRPKQVHHGLPCVVNLFVRWPPPYTLFPVNSAELKIERSSCQAQECLSLRTSKI